MNELAEKLKNKKLALIILIIGAVLMIQPFSGLKDENKDEVGQDYAAALEEKCESVISMIEGAGKVKVMLTLSDGGTTYPVTEKSGAGERTVSSSGKLAVAREDYPQVRGVIVVASGADSQAVREDIVNAVAAVTGASLHNICVFKMK